MNDILKRIREIAVTHCKDYPNINTIPEYECLFAIEETLRGLNAALEDWAKHDKERCERKTMAIKEDAYRVKSLYITPTKQGSRTGIEVEWTPYSGKLRIGGWYDSVIALESRTFTLAEFFNELGVKEKDIKKAMATEEEVKDE